ncbi:nicotinamide-nucleotide adenylyltransferase [Candidatus Bathyarchaeota archaeon]|nr:nicotinamide-nucleotide adenylyltransferase [Candidatus Bathyarchaeota archaeon]
MDDVNTREMLAVVPSLESIILGDFSNEPVPRLPGDPPARLHLVTGVFTVDPKERKVLIQQRSSSKAWYPGYFTDSASGHVRARDNLSLQGVKEDAVRELDEEMGLELQPRDLRLLNFFFDPTFNEIKFIFLAKANSKEPLSLHPTEVNHEGTGWRDSKHLPEQLESQPFVPAVSGIWSMIASRIDDIPLIFKRLEPWQEYWRYFGDLRQYLGYARKRDILDTPFFVGRFQPFHLGHLRCIKHISKDHDSAIIGIGSPQYSRTARNPLTYLERRTMIEKVLQSESVDLSRAWIFPVPDLHNETLWMLNVKLMVENRVTLFSNNEWVRGLARNEGIKLGEKLSFDVERFNGTRIRKMIRSGNPWESLLPEASIKYMRAHGLLACIKKSG